MGLDPAPRSAFVAPVAVLVWCLASSAAAVAQSIQGLVIDHATSEPVVGARVTLRLEGRDPRWEGVTREDGLFSISGAPVGVLAIAVAAFGYSATAVRRVHFTGQPVFLEIALRPAPFATEGITATVRAQAPHLRAQGFYHRLQAGIGRFVTPEELADRIATRPSELLRRVPGLSLGRNGEPLFSRAQGQFSGRPCPPNLYLDGFPVRVGRSGGGPAAAFDNVMPPPEAIEAIEAYPGGATIPAQWRGSNSACGVIVVWTKR